MNLLRGWADAPAPLTVASSAKLEAHDSRAIANIFVDLANEADYELTINPLVGLVYLAHGWILGFTGKPLVRHDVEAWKIGPTIPEICDAFRYRSLVLTRHAKDSNGEKYTAEIEPDSFEMGIITELFNIYAERGHLELLEMTNGIGTPWAKYTGKFYSVISDDEIKNYFAHLIREIKENG